MKSLIVSLIIITLINTVYCQNESPLTTIDNINNVNENVNVNVTEGGSVGNEIQQDIPSQDTDIISESEADEITGGGVWSSIGMIAVVICGCICLERLYSSCKKVYQKRTGRYGFSRLQN
eukprot:UN05912